MNIDNTTHQQIQQLLSLVPAGMLTDAERQQVDQHVAGCEACRATLDQLVQADRELAELFAPVNPPLGFEDRVRRAWRPARFNISLRPGSRKAIAAAAAAILLGTVGYVGAELMENNRLPGAAALPGTGRPVVIASNLRQIAQGLPLYDNSGVRAGENGGEMPKGEKTEGEKVPLAKLQEHWDGPANGDGSGDQTISLGAQVHDTNGRATDIPLGDLSFTNSDSLRDDSGRGERLGRGAGAGSGQGQGFGMAYGIARDVDGDGIADSSRWGETGLGLTKSGSGTLTLSGGNTYAGGTLITNGTLQLGDRLAESGESVTGKQREDGGQRQPGRGPSGASSTGSTVGKGLRTLDETRGGQGGVKLSLATGDHFKLSGLDAWSFGKGKEGRDGGWAGGNDVSMTSGGVTHYAAVKIADQGGKTDGGKTIEAGIKSDTSAQAVTDLAQVKGTGTDLFNWVDDGKGERVLIAAGTDRTIGTNEDILSFGKVEAGDTTPAKVENPAPKPPPAPEVSVVQARKIIRNGDMEFEVESFDSAFTTISRIVGEEKGYVSSTSSEKLPNGKVRGVIVVRVTPDRLDTLVLKLRALGDLKSQKISAQDITKVYYDLDSELRAAHTMEDRIINIIKSGKGEVKDLIEAEKQLGTYREKIEKLEGEIRYYNNMVSLSTLNITAAEKAISSPAAVQVTENVSTGIETEDVEKARAEAIKGIEELKGRVLDSNLKKYDGGQFAANITAEVSPEVSGQLIDRLRQIGRVTRLDIDRKQTSAGQSLPNAPAPRVEKKDTRFVISIYNLANIAPRQTTTSSLAVANVEEAYKSILAAVKAKGGRVVSSNLNRQKPEQTTAAIAFEVPGDQADATLLELRRDREVMSLTVAENPDTQNVTSAKHGFSLQLFSLASVAARETETLVLVSKASVNDAFRKLLDDLRKAEVRILTSQFNEQDAANLSGNIDIEVTRAREADARAALASAGVIFSRNVARSSDTDNTVDTKIRLQIRMVGLNQLAPAQTVRLNVETPDVETRAGDLKTAAVQLGGRVVDSRQSTSATGQVTSRLLLDVPLAKAMDLRTKAQDAGKVRTTDSTQNPAMADSPLARARLEVTLTNASPIVSDDSGLGAAFRKAIATSIRGLLWSVQAIIIGALIVVPWAAILWGGWKVVKRKNAKPSAEC